MNEVSCTKCFECSHTVGCYIWNSPFTNIAHSAPAVESSIGLKCWAHLGLSWAAHGMCWLWAAHIKHRVAHNGAHYGPTGGCPQNSQNCCVTRMGSLWSSLLLGVCTHVKNTGQSLGLVCLFTENIRVIYIGNSVETGAPGIQAKRGTQTIQNSSLTQLRQSLQILQEKVYTWKEGWWG